MADLSDSIVRKETTEMLVCCECGRTFGKRENTQIDNLFCSVYCEDAHNTRRYYKVPENRRYISNAGVIARTDYDYYGGYIE